MRKGIILSIIGVGILGGGLFLYGERNNTVPYIAPDTVYVEKEVKES